MYQPPLPASIVEGAVPSSAPAPWNPLGWSSGLALGVAAAALALVVAMGWGTNTASSDAEPSQGEPSDRRAANGQVQGWIAAYEQVDEGGDDPVCSCAPGCESFAEHCYAVFAQVLDISTDAAVEICGECCRDESGQGVSLVARCDGETVCLFVLLKEAAPSFPGALHARFRRGLRLHRRDIGDLSAFELSPLHRARILPLLVSN